MIVPRRTDPTVSATASCISSPSPLRLFSICSPSPLHLLFVSSPSALHLLSISSPSPLHLHLLSISSLSPLRLVSPADVPWEDRGAGQHLLQLFVRLRAAQRAEVLAQTAPVQAALHGQLLNRHHQPATHTHTHTYSRALVIYVQLKFHCVQFFSFLQFLFSSDSFSSNSVVFSNPFFSPMLFQFPFV